VNGPPPVEHTAPDQLGFVNVAEDISWMRPIEPDRAKGKRRRSTPARDEASGGVSTTVRSSQSPAPAGADVPHIPTTWSVIERLKAARDQRQAVQP
jgi:hypothetical protein